MKMRLLKTGTPATDKASGLKGTISHQFVSLGRNILYVIQPRGTSKQDGQPLSRTMLEEARLTYNKRNFETVDLPVEVLGTEVTSKSTGFKGMAVALVQHPGGCLHISIQSRMVLPDTGLPAEPAEFNLNDCKGKMIKKLSKKELEKSKKEKPSPTGNVMSPRSARIGPSLYRR